MINFIISFKMYFRVTNRRAGVLLLLAEESVEWHKCDFSW